MDPNTRVYYSAAFTLANLFNSQEILSQTEKRVETALSQVPPTIISPQTVIQVANTPPSTVRLANQARRKRRAAQLQEKQTPCAFCKEIICRELRKGFFDTNICATDSMALIRAQRKLQGLAEVFNDLKLADHPTPFESAHSLWQKLRPLLKAKKSLEDIKTCVQEFLSPKKSD